MAVSRDQLEHCLRTGDYADTPQTRFTLRAFSERIDFLRALKSGFYFHPGGEDLRPGTREEKTT